MIVVGPLIQVTIIALNVYLWIVFAYVIMGWLVNFRVINLQNQFVHMVWEFLVRITDPVLRRIRRYLPAFGGMDIYHRPVAADPLCPDGAVQPARRTGLRITGLYGRSGG